jgi:hypothetical protein
MAAMSDHLKQLEAHENLEAEVIKKTKVHKVLKAIIKLTSIPKEEEHNFKQRSNDLLTKWGGALAADSEPATNGTTNGVKDEDDPKSDAPKEESPVDTKEDVKMEDTPAAPAADADSADTKVEDTNGDVAMSEADKEVIKDAPAAQAEVESSIEGTTEAATATEPATTTSDPVAS